MQPNSEKPHSGSGRMSDWELKLFCSLTEVGRFLCWHTRPWANVICLDQDFNRYLGNSVFVSNKISHPFREICAEELLLSIPESW